VSELLLHARGSPNARDGLGQTPLALAAHRGDTALVRALVQAFADANIIDIRGRAPLQHAISGEAPLSLVRMLVVEAWAEPSQAVAMSARRSKLPKDDVVAFLIRAARVTKAQAVQRCFFSFADPTDDTGTRRIEPGDERHPERLVRLLRECPWLQSRSHPSGSLGPNPFLALQPAPAAQYLATPATPATGQVSGGKSVLMMHPEGKKTTVDYVHGQGQAQGQGPELEAELPQAKQPRLDPMGKKSIMGEAAPQDSSVQQLPALAPSPAAVLPSTCLKEESMDEVAGGAGHPVSAPAQDAHAPIKDELDELGASADPAPCPAMTEKLPDCSEREDEDRPDGMAAQDGAEADHRPKADPPSDPAGNRTTMMEASANQDVSTPPAMTEAEDAGLEQQGEHTRKRMLSPEDAD